MANPTSNFNWQMPTSTDLVTDLPADFEVFGQAVDTALMDLKGGTTDQVLAKNSNTDMDFKWVADAAGMTNPMTTTGDTIYSSSGSTPDRLGIGTAGQVLQVNSGATAPEWAVPTSAGLSFSLLNAGGTALTGATTITISAISGYDQYFVFVTGASSANASSNFGVQINADTSGYGYFGQSNTAGGSYSGGDFTNYQSTSTSAFNIVQMSGAANSVASFGVSIVGGKTTGMKMFTGTGGASAGASNSQIFRTALGYGDGGGTAISSISITSSSGNFDAGTVYIYGAA